MNIRPPKKEVAGHAPSRPRFFDPPFEVERPAAQTIPLVLSSPHSGRTYPAPFLAASRLDLMTLRRSEDSFVDELFAGAAGLGAPLLKALFPRAYLDPNREPYELDPAMFEDALPAYANTRSLRVAGGLGTVARVVTDGAEIYRGKMAFAEAENRIETLYLPYHHQIKALLDETRARFGYALLLDCHSMPSVGGPMDQDSGHNRADFVLGDRFGTACAPAFTQAAEDTLNELGYTTVRNNPYAGGYTTDHYGRPVNGFHALQIEINRALYMDEELIVRGPAFSRVGRDMSRLIAALARLRPGSFRSRL
jgi:N-formylglutamate amidohydrolase